jgi:acetoin utilization deacetylase AcuC-like enzyme
MGTAITVIPSEGHVHPGHPEAPFRFSKLVHWDQKPYFGKLLWLEHGYAEISKVARVHSQGMISALEEACLQAPAIIDQAPTFVTRSSFQDGLKAAGGALACSQAVMSRQAGNAFAVIRPPGHHAEPENPMGFCIFNNLAITARDCLEQGIGSLLIVDFDAHHGNGTQAAFWQDDRVGFFSSHQEMIYPGSGQMETAAHARGRIVNLPLPAYAGDQSFSIITQEILIPLVQKRQPELILVSAGFDSHWRDPLTSLGLSSRGFYDLSRNLVMLADEFCRSRIIFILEGGYLPEIVASGVDACLRALTGENPMEGNDPSPYQEKDIRDRIGALLSLHGFN